MKKTVEMLGLLFALVCLVSVLGCAEKHEEKQLVQPAGIMINETELSNVELTLAPDPPVALRDTEFSARITAPDGTPLTGADVVFDLSMPGMYHGENRPAAVESEPGVYTAKGILTMGGEWLVRVEVTAAGAAEDGVQKHDFHVNAAGG